MTKRATARWLEVRFEAAGDAAKATQMKAYMKSDLAFFGVDQAALRSACRELAKAHADEPIDSFVAAADGLIRSRYFEVRSAAIGLLERRRNELGPAHLDLLIDWVRVTACWAHVDWIATKLVGRVIERHPKERRCIERWARDEHMWVRRTALLAQLDELRAGKSGDFALFARVAVPMLEEKEFFIRKAIGWVLRDVSKKRPELTRRFVADHDAQMSGLTKREASKYL